MGNHRIRDDLLVGWGLLNFVPREEEGTLSYQLKNRPCLLFLIHLEWSDSKHH